MKRIEIIYNKLEESLNLFKETKKRAAHKFKVNLAIRSLILGTISALLWLSDPRYFIPALLVAVYWLIEFVFVFIASLTHSVRIDELVGLIIKDPIDTGIQFACIPFLPKFSMVGDEEKEAIFEEYTGMKKSDERTLNEAQLKLINVYS